MHNCNMSKKSPLVAAAAPAVYFCNNRRCDSAFSHPFTISNRFPATLPAASTP
jgi:hypothetical protein